MELEDVVLTITGRMDAGFQRIHEKMEKIQEDANVHRPQCAHRFMQIESWQVVHDTKVNEKEKADEKIEKEEEKSRDWWKWIIRASSTILATWALTDWGKMVLQHYGVIK